MSVTVTVSSRDSSVVSVPGGSSLTFSTSNWDTAQTVTVLGVHDDDAADDSVVVDVSGSGGDYGAVSAEVTVAVDDDDSAGLVLSHTSVPVEEGDTETFTVELATEPTTSVTVTVTSQDTTTVSVVSPPLMFTTANWDTAQTVTVSGVEDDDATDEFTTVIAVASGGDYGDKTATVRVDVDDDDNAAMVLSPTTVPVNEGDSEMFTVRLATEPTGTVTVTVSSRDTAAVSVTAGSSLTFTTSNWATAQTVTVSGVHDDDAVNDSAIVDLSGFGGDYGTVTATVPVTVVDDETAGMTLSRDLVPVDEGASEMFTVQLNTRPSASVMVAATSFDVDAVSVTGGSALTFTTANWDTAQTVTVSGVQDDDHSDESTVVRLNASGGDYGAVSADVTVEVDDDDTAELVLSHTTVPVGEGRSDTFTVQLATAPTGSHVLLLLFNGDDGAVSVTAVSSMSFERSNWDIARTIRVSGVQDDDAADESVEVTLWPLSQDEGYRGANAAVIVTVEVDDDDTAGLVVGRMSVPVDEGDSDTFTVQLATEPDGDVTVSVSSRDTGAVSVTAGSSLTFTTSSWDTVQTVQVTGVDDDDAVDESTIVDLSGSGGDYGAESATVAVDVDDDDIVGLVLDRMSVPVDEGDSDTFTVQLATEPDGDVTVSVSSRDTGAVSVTAGSSLTFTTSSWDTVQTVQVTGVDDDDAVDESTIVDLSGSGGDYGAESATVAVDVDDDDIVGLVLDRMSVPVDEGDSDTFTVQLATEPDGDVTVSVSSRDTGAVSVTAGSSLTFTTSSWDTVQTVQVTGVDDDDAVDESTIVDLSGSGGDYGAESATVAVDVDDDDIVGLVLDRMSVPVDEGDSETFTVQLATEPSQAVSVTLVSGDTEAVSVEPAQLDFNPVDWATAQTVTVRGVQDDDASNENGVTITVTASGGDYAGKATAVNVDVTDDDTPALIVDPASVPLVEGRTATFEVELATEPTGDVTVAVSSQDSGAVSVTGGSSLTFTTSNWDTAQTVQVTGVEDADAADESVVVDLDASGGDYGTVAATVTVSVDDDDSPRLVLSRSTVPVDEGQIEAFTVELSTAPSSSVQVTAASADTGAVFTSPAPLTFTTTNWDTAQTVQVVAVPDDDAADESVMVTLEATGGDYEGLTGTVDVEVDDDETAALVVAPTSLPVTENGTATFNVELSVQPLVAVTVSLSSDDDGAVSVPSTPLTFTASDWNTAQTVTVSGVPDDDAANESVMVTLEATGGEYQDATATVAVTVTDDDTEALIVDPLSVPVAEGASATFAVELATRPERAVVIAAVSADPGAVSVPAPRVTFTSDDWSTAQTVTVSGVEDDDADDEPAVLVILSVIGFDAGYVALTEDVAVTVTVADDDDFVPGVPGGLRVVREELTRARVTWDEPINEGTPLTGYTMRWRQRPSGAWTETTVTTPAASLTGLSAGSEYEVQVRAVNSVGDGSWSPSVTAYADDCSAARTDSCSVTVGSSAAGRTNVHDRVADRDWYQVSLTSGTSYRIDVKGDDVDDPGGTLADPEVSLYYVTSFPVSGATDNDSGSGHNARLLFTATSTAVYYVAVGGHGGNGTGTYTVSVHPERPPRFTGGMRILFPENAFLSHPVTAVDDDPDDSILDFQVTGGADMGMFSITSGGRLTMNVTPDFDAPSDDDGDNVYEFELTVFSGPAAGMVDGSATALFRLEVTNLVDDTPSAPYGPTLLNEYTSELEFFWVLPDEKLPVIGHEMEYGEPGGSTSMLESGPDRHVVVTGLDPATDYRFRVRGTNSDGPGQWSGWETATTDDCADRRTTTCVLTEDETFTATLHERQETDPYSGPADSDWFAITAESGSGRAYYRVHVKGSEPTDYGGTLPNPQLSLYIGDDAAPTLHDRDGGIGNNAGTHFSMNQGQTAYVRVTSEGFYGRGTYTVLIERDLLGGISNSRTLTIDEHSTLTHQVMFHDPDPDDTFEIFDIRSGPDSRDGSLFSIDEDGNLSMNIVPDHERPQDDDGDNLYEFWVRFNNISQFGVIARFISSYFSVTVADVIEVPEQVTGVRLVDAGLTSVTIDRGEAANLGPDITHYEVQISRTTSPRVWTVTDIGLSQTHMFTSLMPGTFYVIQARGISDEGTGPWSQDEYVVTDACADTVGSGECDLSVPDSQTGWINVRSSGDDLDLYTVTLQDDTVYRIDVKGAEAADRGGTLADPKLRILDSNGTPVSGAEDDNSGAGNNALFDFEPSSSGTYHIEVSSSDSGAGTYTVAVAVRDAPPRITGDTALSIPEHTALSRVLSVDDDPGDTVTAIEITGGPDMARFTIDSNDVLSMSIDPDYERPQDADTNNVYLVDITVTSQSSHGLPAKNSTVRFSVTVTDVVEAPEQVTGVRLVDEGLASVTIDRGQAANLGPDITHYEARIAFLGSDAWTVTGIGLSQTRMFTTLSAGFWYQIQVRAVNAEGSAPWSGSISAILDDCADAVGSDECDLSVPGSQTGRINISAGSTVDKDIFTAELEAGIVYRIDVKGGEAADPGGTLADPTVRILDSNGTPVSGAEDDNSGAGSNARLDFEPSSSGTYYIEVSKSGSGAGTYTVVASVRDAPPRITGDTALSIPEHTALSRVLSVDDDPGDTVTAIEITGGPDMARFTIDSNDVLSMSIDPDYERPQDADTNNVYLVDITVTSQSSHGLPAKSSPYRFIVTVTDVVEAPEQVTDAELVDEGLASVTIDRGQAANLGPDITHYEARIAFLGSDAWTVTGIGLSQTRMFTTLSAGFWYQIQVRAVNAEGNAPWSGSISAILDDCADAVGSDECDLSVPGSQTGRINISAGSTVDKDIFEVTLEANTVYRIDVKGGEQADPGGTLADPTVRILDSNGDPISGAEDDNSGAGSNARLDFEPSSSGTYYIEVSKSGPGAGTYTVVASVRDAPPRITGDTALSISEHTALSRALTVDDDPGDTVTAIEITGGPDMARFTIDSNNVLSMNINPDFEHPQDADTNNVYIVDITVTSQSSHGLPAKSSPYRFIVTVTDVLEAPDQITDARVVDEGLTSVTIDRGQAANLGPDITHYEVRITFIGGLSPWTVTDIGLNQQHTFNSLAPGVWYWIQVRAVNADGNGPWSTTIWAILDDCADTVGSDECDLSVPGTQTGDISVSAGSTVDKDIFEVTLEANTVYRIDVKGGVQADPGGSLPDPTVRILDSNGDPISGAEDDNSGTGSNARLDFEPSSSGTYYIEVSSSDTRIGTYTVSVVVAP